MHRCLEAIRRDGVILLLVWTPLAFGSAPAWADALLQVHVFGLTCACVHLPRRGAAAVATAYLALANTLQHLEDHAGAVRTLQHLATHFPRQDVSNALRMMQRAVSIDPQQIASQRALARLLEQSGRRDHAQQVYQRLAAQETPDPYVFYKLGE